MSKQYKCECFEKFDDDTGISEGAFECLGCAASSGYCECVCDCGQCLYTETPCGAPPGEEPCKLCVMRQDWQMAEQVLSILSQVEITIAQTKGDLATPEVLGMPTHDYLRNRLEMRLEPCAKALKMVQGAAAASAIVAEVKNVLRLEGYTEGRRSCGIPACNCHLENLNDLLEDMMTPEMKELKRQIGLAAADRHMHAGIVDQRLEAWERAKMEKLGAEDMAEAAYRSARTEAHEAAGKFHGLVEKMKNM